MATGLKAFSRGQIGNESTAGTAVAATRPLHFTSLDIGGEYMEFSEPVEELNSLALYHRSTPVNMAPVDIGISGELTFEDAVVYLEGMLKGNVAPSQPDVAVDLYTFTPTYSAVNGLETYTLEAGDNEQEIEVPYTVFQEMGIEFAAGEVCTFDVSGVGQRIVESSFTGSLATPNVESAIGSKVQLYVDTSWAGIGGTQFANATLLEGSVTIRSGLTVVKRADGNLYFTKAIENPRRIITCNLTLEHDTASKAWRALYEANTARFIELRFVGSNITGGFDRFIKIQWAGRFRALDWGDDDGGVKLIKARSESHYDGTGTAEAKALVQTALNAVTEW